MLGHFVGGLFKLPRNLAVVAVHQLYRYSEGHSLDHHHHRWLDRYCIVRQPCPVSGASDSAQRASFLPGSSATCATTVTRIQSTTCCCDRSLAQVSDPTRQVYQQSFGHTKFTGLSAKEYTYSRIHKNRRSFWRCSLVGVHSLVRFRGAPAVAIAPISKAKERP